MAWQPLRPAGCFTHRTWSSLWPLSPRGSSGTPLSLEAQACYAQPFSLLSPSPQHSSMIRPFLSKNHLLSPFTSCLLLGLAFLAKLTERVPLTLSPLITPPTHSSTHCILISLPVLQHLLCLGPPCSHGKPQGLSAFLLLRLMTEATLCPLPGTTFCFSPTL